MIFVDRSLLPLLWPILDTFTTVRHVVVMDDGGAASSRPSADGLQIHDYEALLAARQPRDFHVGDENLAASMCYTTRHHRQPQGRRLLAPLDRSCTRWA